MSPLAFALCIVSSADENSYKTEKQRHLDEDTEALDDIVRTTLIDL